MKKRGFTLFLLFCLLSGWVSAQSLGDQRVSLSLRETPLESALYMLMDDFGIPLSFSNSILPEKYLTAEIKDRSLPRVLDFLLQGTDLAYRQMGRQIVLYGNQYDVPPIIDHFTLSGYISDSASGEPLLSASLIDTRSGRGTHTNAYGYFSLQLPRGEARLQVSYLGYEPREIKVEISQDQILDLAMSTSLVLDEVVIVATEQLSPYEQAGYSIHSLSREDAGNLPSLGGEPDVVRTATLLPGVQTGADGFGGMYVRGGDAGQNLVLLDGVPVYNLSHAAGLFSIFNNAVVKTAELTKGAAPARYGGRLSSVLDVRTREGNNQEFSGSLDLGMLTARVLAEGPIIKGRSSFLIAARKSFINWYLKPISRQNKALSGDDGSTSFGFYDLNAKLNYKLSPNDMLFFSFYSGEDNFANGAYSNRLFEAGEQGAGIGDFRYEQSYNEHLRWGNTVGALRWTHLFGPRLFATTSLTYSRLRVRAGYEAIDSLFRMDPPELTGSRLDYGRYGSGIEDLGLRMDLELQAGSQHTLRFGGSLNQQLYEPGVLQYDEATAELVHEQHMKATRITAQELSLYLEDDMRLGERLTLNAGLRASLLNSDGEFYPRFEPRFAARFQAGKGTALRASFGIHTQVVHLLTSSNLGLPIDLWVPTTAEIPPQSARQWALGVTQSLPWGLTASLEGYYKNMDNLVAYTDGAYFINDWRENVTLGEGHAYGLEFLLRRTEGKTRGWIAYSFGKTNRRFDKVNFGRTYPFRYDRRHEVKVAVRHRLSERLEVTADWIYGSGLAYSLPDYKLTYDYPGVPDLPLDLFVFSEKNQNRLPPNHRLDLGISLDFPASGRFSHGLKAGVYNVYNRQNPLYYDLRPTMEVKNGGLREGKQLVQVTLAPILPYFNYTIRF